ERARAAGVDVGVATRVPQARPDTEAPADDAPADSDAGTISPLSYMPAADGSSAENAITEVLLKQNGAPVPVLSENIRPILSRVRASLDDTETDLSKTLDVL